LTLEGRVSTPNRVEVQTMRQYAIAVLGRHQQHAARALPVLEAELERDRDSTKSIAKQAITEITGGADEEQSDPKDDGS
jgi:hypothetical protein